ncbi:MAG: TIM barrel protein, partial [Deltaproteobacteria bacterium]|nr:TIM barrel protein [Deltaproteobacteria bacterium]
PNLKMLGSYFDEIELLLFESKDIESLFPNSVIEALKCISNDLDIGYSIHLPTDISISTGDTRLQFDAIECYKKTIDRMLPLAPSAFFLHVPYEEPDAKYPTVEKWRQRIKANLRQLLDSAVDAPLVSVETLDYPVDFIEDIVQELDLSLCMDVGHLLLYGYDILDIFRKHSSRIISIHLHGVEKNQDHLGLDHLPQRYISAVMEILRPFRGILSIEVFSFQHLIPSLRTLENWWNSSNRFSN